MIEFFKTKKGKKEENSKSKTKKSISNTPQPIQTKSSIPMNKTASMSSKISIGKERSMDEKVKIWDQIAGMNPTGQMLYQNGTFKPKGNIAQIVTPQQLQSQNLEKTATNTPVSQKVTVEGFENQKKDDNEDIYFRRLVYGLIAVISALIFVLNIKKI